MPTIKYITTTSSGSRRLHNTSATTYSGVHTSLVNVTKIQRSTNRASYAARSIKPKHNLAVKTIAYNYNTLLPQSQTRVDEMEKDIYGFHWMIKSFSTKYMSTLRSITAHISLALKKCYAEHKRKYPQTDFTQERFDKMFRVAKTELSKARMNASQDDMVAKLRDTYYGIVSNYINDALSEGYPIHSITNASGKRMIHAYIREDHYGSRMFEILPRIPESFDWSADISGMIDRYVSEAIRSMGVDVLLNIRFSINSNPFSFSNVCNIVWAELFQGIERRYDSLNAPLRTKAIVTAGPNGVMCIA